MHESIQRVHIFLPWHIGVHSEYAIQEDDDAQDRGGDEQLSVNTQPSKIQPDLLSKVFSVKIKPKVGLMFSLLSTEY